MCRETVQYVARMRKVLTLQSGRLVQHEIVKLLGNPAALDFQTQGVVEIAPTRANQSACKRFLAARNNGPSMGRCS